MAVIGMVLSFLSGAGTAVLTQFVTARLQHKLKLEETKLSMYLSWLPFLCECYAQAVHPVRDQHDEPAFLQKKLEVMGAIQLIGPSEAIDAASSFFEMVECGSKGLKQFDEQALHRRFTYLSCVLCCAIHGEDPGDCEKP